MPINVCTVAIEPISPTFDLACVFVIWYASKLLVRQTYAIATCRGFFGLASYSTSRYVNVRVFMLPFETQIRVKLMHNIRHTVQNAVRISLLNVFQYFDLALTLHTYVTNYCIRTFT